MKARILTLDIETAPHNAYAWGIWQQNIAPGQIIQPTYMLSWAAKFLGERDVLYRTCFDGDSLSTLHTVLSNTDVIITYNGDKFDMKHINREFVEQEMMPPRPLSSIDLLKVVKARFNFPSNRLDYVASTLLNERKLETGGFDLWPAFMQGDDRALKVMKRYNIGDVQLTEKLYKRIRPWIKNHPHVAPYDDALGDSDAEYVCPTCGSHKIRLERPRRTRCFAIRQLNCNACGTWFDGKRRKL